MYRDVITITTHKKFIDITDILNNIVKISGIKNGILMVNSIHTTCGLKIMENEILSLSDIDDFLKRIVPNNIKYAHDKIDLRQVPEDERINGISHVRMLFFNSNISIPVNNNELVIGKWQRIFLVEMDGKRERNLIVTIY